MGSYVTRRYQDPTDDSYSRQSAIEANKNKIQTAITKDPDMNEDQRQGMREYRDMENTENNPDHNAISNTGAYARGGAVSSCAGHVTMAQLRKRHGGNV